MPAAPRTPVRVTLHPEYLSAFKSERPGYTELIVSKSPVVRVTDEMFRPVAELFRDMCAMLDEKRVMVEPGMAFGKEQFYAVKLFCDCPDEEHICKDDPKQTEKVFNF